MQRQLAAVVYHSTAPSSPPPSKKKTFSLTCTVYLQTPRVFHNLMVLSREAETIWRLSAENATLITSFSWPTNWRVVLQLKSTIHQFITVQIWRLISQEVNFTTIFAFLFNCRWFNVSHLHMPNTQALNQILTKICGCWFSTRSTRCQNDHFLILLILLLRGVHPLDKCLESHKIERTFVFFTAKQNRYFPLVNSLKTQRWTKLLCNCECSYASICNNPSHKQLSNRGTSKNQPINWSTYL